VILMRGELICLVGPDGVGKSTQAEILIDFFRKKGIEYDYKWARFYHFFSIPLLISARILGLSEFITLKDGAKIGYHYFYKSQMISFLYPYFLYMDILLFTITKIYLPLINGKNIVCDRFVYDTIIDVMVSTNNQSFYKSKIAKMFLKLIPRKSTFIMLIADSDILRNRREDIKYDKTLDLKINYYSIVAKEFDIQYINASGSIEEVNNILKGLLI